MKYLITILLTLLFANSSFAQKENIQTLTNLARQAKNNGENQKAITYYERLQKATNSENSYNQLVELYLGENQFKDAEKLIRKRSKKFQARPDFLVDLGALYEKQELNKEARKQYEEAVNGLKKYPRASRNVAHKFSKYKKYAYAEKIYLQSRKQEKDESLYQFELANVYSQQGKTKAMVNEYLSILGKNKGYKQTVQNLFYRLLNPDPGGTQQTLLKEQLLLRIQQQPDKEVYSEILIWLFIQDKNFNGAFLQAKSIDKRLNENGKRIYKLASICTANSEYKVAIKCYNYVISLNEKSPYYLSSRIKTLETKKLELIDNKNSTSKEFTTLCNSIQYTIDEIGKTMLSYSLFHSLSEINAFYLDSISKGISVLENTLSIPGLSKQNIARTKIALADLYVIDDQIWEASLLYSQVEKEFKYDGLGETAKFKNAKIAFYVGDFGWAQAQLDVLKGSTSKLIANDAMDLSLTITDNVAIDSIVEPLQMYARADLLKFKKDFVNARLTLDSISTHFPTNTLGDDILLMKYQMLLEEKKYDTAAESLKELIANFGEDILGDNALFYLADLQENYLNKPEVAQESYKLLITTYPSSIFVVESRKRFRKLRGDKLEEGEFEIKKETP